MKSPSRHFKPGTRVQWKWLGYQIPGQVIEVFFEPVSKTIKNKTIRRNGSAEKPAYLVKSDAGNLALKLQTELQTEIAKPTSASEWHRRKVKSQA